MVGGYPSWDLNCTSRREIAGRRLEEEERFPRKRVLQLLDVVRIVTPYCDYLLLESCIWFRGRRGHNVKY